MNLLPNILFLVKEGRKARLDAGLPREFLYGYSELLSYGCNVELLTDTEVGFERSISKVQRLINAAIFLLSGIPGWGLIQLWLHRRRFDKFDLIFVSTNTFGLCLGVLSRLGILRSPIMFIAMGLIDKQTPIHWRCVYRWALRDAHVIALAKYDAETLSVAFGREISYLSFGVDKEFWHMAMRAGGDYVLTIGNDKHRDYDTLLKAWQPNFPLLRIVTRLPVTTTASNIEIIYGDWHTQSLSDIEIRSLIQGANFVVLSIRDTVQPSGQSVALQSMACGKTVLITDFPGLWNRELMLDGVTCILSGAPGGVDELASAVANLVAEPEQTVTIGAAARRVVESELNSERMAEQIRAHMEAIIGRSLLPVD